MKPEILSLIWTLSVLLSCCEGLKLGSTKNALPPSSYPRRNMYDEDDNREPTGEELRKQKLREINRTYTQEQVGKIILISNLRQG
mmetsp:Transcript_44282/g.50998  ORF Transcript_44282/g.50998 Transcript_44282/m.50998 type:complete len:85 (-) Transcript_44282:156-410(-)